MGNEENYESAFKRAKRFVYKNARPIDMARWKYHFENGSREEVLEALECYQNSDGGFGYGLEPDYWNPHSSPAQVYAATEVLWELGMEKEDAEHPIIQGILDFLSSGKHFEDDLWLHTIETNNNFPHAEWWDYPYSPWWQDTKENRFATNFNPSAALVGFVLYFEDPDTEFYEYALSMAQEYVKIFMKNTEKKSSEMNVLKCFCRLYDYIVEAELTDQFDFDDFEQRLKETVHGTITQDQNLYIANWGVTLCKPSVFFENSGSIFYESNEEIAEFEKDFISKTQLSDGSWEVTWEWGKKYQAAWGVAKNWWKSRIAIDNLLYWRGFDE